MPIVTIHMLEGRKKEVKKKLISDVTDTICRDLDVPAKSVRIIIREMKVENFGIAGLPVDEYRNLK